MILYGSYARGDFDEGSDIDLFILFESKETMRKGYDGVIKILAQSNLLIEGNIQSLEELKCADPYFLQGVLGEGRILYWDPRLHIDLMELLQLKPFALVEYSLSNISPADKCKLAFALSGRRMRKYRYGGLVQRLGGWKVGKSSFAIPLNHIITVEKLLESEKIAYRVRIIWATVS